MLREGNVFTGVCYSVHAGRGRALQGGGVSGRGAYGRGCEWWGDVYDRGGH